MGPSGPEAQHLQTVPLKDRVANRIVFALAIVAVLPTIDLDRQPPRETKEVEVVAAERRLTAKVIATLAQPPESAP